MGWRRRRDGTGLTGLTGTRRAGTGLTGTGRTAVGTLVVLAGCLGLAACHPGQLASGIRQAGHNVSASRATIDRFTAELGAGGPKTYAVTYRTTGTAPAAVLYAVRPPGRLAFRESPAAGAGSGTDVVANGTGEFSCTPPARTVGPAARWTCRKLGAARSAVENQVLDLYTPAHWAALLTGYSLAAGLAGVRITESRRTVHGFRLRCVDYRTPGAGGTSTVCATAQGILGYVKAAGIPAGFEITSYSASPAASLFELPPGASVIRPAR
jgi:hypothetical protein